MELVSLWASLSIWLATLWVALWQCYFIYKVMEVLGKNPKMSWFFLTIAILWVALVESAAIYWLIIALQALWKEFVDPLASVWAWLAIWLTWLWVWFWEWVIVREAVNASNKNPDDRNKIMSYMILLIALVESSAIYWIIIAIKILGDLNIGWLVAIWAALSIWLTWLWVSLWMSIIAKSTMEVIWNHWIENNKIVIPFTILWIALVESAAIYGLIISFNILSLSVDKWLLAIWAALSVWLAWLWVSLWIWSLVSRSISKIGLPWISWKDLIPVTILWVALVESAAIYGLVVAFQITWASAAIWLNAIWAWLAIWIAGFGVWLWEWYIWEKAMNSMWLNWANRARLVTYMVLFIAIVESVAIYWLIIAIQLVWKGADLWLSAVWTWLSIGLAWLWVAIWGSLLSWRSIDISWRRPELWGFFITVTILWMALVESAAIYWLIISFNTIWISAQYWLASLWAGLAIWLSWFWVWISEWLVISWTFGAMERNPKERTKYLTFMILFVALVEVLAIYWLIVAFQILWKIPQ